MRAFPAVAMLVFAIGLGSIPGKLEAQSSAESFQLALFNPVQIRPEDTDIRILRLSLIYGKNVSVKGLDVGLVSHNTGGISKGLQYGLVGYVEGDFLGWQDTAINVVDGVFTGFQGPGLYNGIGAGEAFQLGIINNADDISGFQLGLVNIARSMYGLQIGLVNIIQDKTDWSFLPIVNWSF